MGWMDDLSSSRSFFGEGYLGSLCGGFGSTQVPCRRDLSPISLREWSGAAGCHEMERADFFLARMFIYSFLEEEEGGCGV